MVFCSNAEYADRPGPKSERCCSCMHRAVVVL